MIHIKLSPHQNVKLEASSSESLGFTVTKALNEAIEFTKDNNLESCELVYNGFTFDITKDSDLNQKIGDYYFWLDNK